MAYELQCRICDPGLEVEAGGDPKWTSASVNIRECRCRKLNLVPGTRYEFRVRAKNVLGWGAFSAAIGCQTGRTRGAPGEGGGKAEGGVDKAEGGGGEVAGEVGKKDEEGAKNQAEQEAEEQEEQEQGHEKDEKPKAPTKARPDRRFVFNGSTHKFDPRAWSGLDTEGRSEDEDSCSSGSSSSSGGSSESDSDSDSDTDSEDDEHTSFRYATSTDGAFDEHARQFYYDGSKDGNDDGGAVGVVPAWHELVDEATSAIYYYHSVTGEAKWEAPLWFDEIDQDSGAVYYVNSCTGESQWEAPEDFVPVVRLDLGVGGAHGAASATSSST